MVTGHITGNPTSTKRPFYFWMGLWGEEFWQKFLTYGLPSLLAPGNLPGVAAERSAFFIVATTAEDWKAFTTAPIFTEMTRYVIPIFLELPPPTPYRPVWLRSVDSKKLC